MSNPLLHIPRFSPQTFLTEILCADLFAGTCDPKTKRLRADCSSDGLHLNGVGYRRIAETIFDEVIKSVLIRELDMD